MFILAVSETAGPDQYKTILVIRLVEIEQHVFSSKEMSKFVCCLAIIYFLTLSLFTGLYLSDFNHLISENGELSVKGRASEVKQAFLFTNRNDIHAWLVGYFFFLTMLLGSKSFIIFVLILHWRN